MFAADEQFGIGGDPGAMEPQLHAAVDIERAI